MISDLCLAVVFLVAAVFCLRTAPKIKLEAERGYLRTISYILFLFAAVFVVLSVVTMLGHK